VLHSTAALAVALMRPVYEPGKIAAWLAPRSGINGQPLYYEYVRF
jgi:benzoyl-CoA 2,3-epoxidase subunit B